MAIFGRRKPAPGGGPRAADMTMVRCLAPFEHLDQARLAQAAEAAWIEPVSARTGIATEAGVSTFLHSGQLKLAADGRPGYQLAGDDPASAFPLPAGPRWRITTTGACELLRVPTRFMAPTPAQAEEQALLAWLDEQPDDRVYRDFFHALRDSECELPTLPDLARRIGVMIDDPTTASEDIARIIQSDPALAARLMSVVNSVAYQGRVPIQNLSQAVSRLGREQIRSLAFSFLVKSVFRTDSALLKTYMRAVWSHSCHVGAIAAVLAARTPGLDPERAMLAGLVHDIGVVPVLAKAREYPCVLGDPDGLDRMIHGLRADMGVQTLRQWGLDREFTDIAARAEDWWRIGDAVPDYLDVVIVAQLHAYVGTPRMKSLPRIDQVPAFRKLAAGTLTPQGSMAIIEEAGRDIEALRRLLENG